MRLKVRKKFDFSAKCLPMSEKSSTFAPTFSFRTRICVRGIECNTNIINNLKNKKTK